VHTVENTWIDVQVSSGIVWSKSGRSSAGKSDSLICPSVLDETLIGHSTFIIGYETEVIHGHAWLLMANPKALQSLAFERFSVAHSMVTSWITLVEWIQVIWNVGFTPGHKVLPRFHPGMQKGLKVVR
jgi:hypothetical protein